MRKKLLSKTSAVLLGGLLGGVLVMGIGCGVAFAEYLSFDYDNTTLAPTEDIATKEHICTLTENESAILNGCDTTITDDSVEAGTIKVVTTYNQALINVEIGESHSREYGANNPVVFISPYTSYLVDDFTLFMQNKDVILEGLRNGVIMNFDPDYSYSTTAYVNPADISRVYEGSYEF